MRNKILYLLTALVIISGCARPYRKVNMSVIPFKECRVENKISYSIRQGLMYNTRNFFYAKREQKKDVSLMAFKIINKSELPININDLQFSCGAAVPIAPIRKEDYYNAVKQKSELYWLYSVGVIVYPRPPKDSKKFIPLPFGVVFAAANYGISYKANKKLKRDLEMLDLTNKVVQPGDSIFGTLSFRNVANCGDIFITTKE